MVLVRRKTAPLGIYIVRDSNPLQHLSRYFIDNHLHIIFRIIAAKRHVFHLTAIFQDKFTPSSYASEFLSDLSRTSSLVVRGVNFGAPSSISTIATGQVLVSRHALPLFSIIWSFRPKFVLCPYEILVDLFMNPVL